MASNLIGWDLLYHSVENEILKKEDILVTLIHWILIKNGYRNIGLGTDIVSNQTYLFGNS